MCGVPAPTLAGMFRFPCGVWVAPYRMRSGAVWFLPLPGATRPVNAEARKV